MEEKEWRRRGGAGFYVGDVGALGDSEVGIGLWVRCGHDGCLRK